VPIVHALIAAEVGIDRATAGPAGGGGAARPRLRGADRRRRQALIEPLALYGIERSRLAVVTAGRRSRASGAWIARLTRNPSRDRGDAQSGKGARPVVSALSRLADRRWRLTCAGSAERDPDTRRACDRC
jgi:hypothetical protein